MEIKRQWKYGTKALLICGGTLVLLVLLYGLLERHPWRWDATANKEQSLSEQTKKVLKDLEGEVTIVAFFRRGDDIDDVYIRRKVDDLLKEYALRSPRIRYTMRNPDLEIQEAAKYGITTDGTTVFLSGKNRKDIYKSQLFDYSRTVEEAMPSFLGEEVFTNALLRVTREKQKGVYFLEGHGEKNLAGAEPSSFSEAKRYLEKNNYEVKSFSFVTSRKVPEEADLLIVAGPTKVLPSEEDKRIHDYLKKGKLLLLLEPNRPVGPEETLKELKVTPQPDIVLDPSRHFLLGAHYPAPLLKEHPITKELTGMNPILALARSLGFDEKGGARSGLETEEFLSTSPDAWGETNVTDEGESDSGEAKFNAGQDIKGPLSLGLAIKKEEKPLAVVVGDSDFASNGLIEVPGNLDLFLNIVSWLTGEEVKLGIGPRKTEFRSLSATPGQARLIAYTSQLGYPLVVLAAGLVYWFKRRR